MKALCNEFKLQYVEIKTVKNVKLHTFSSITISFFIIFFNFNKFFCNLSVELPVFFTYSTSTDKNIINFYLMIKFKIT